MLVPFLPLPKQSNLIFLSACAALLQTSVQCPLILGYTLMAVGTFRHPAASGGEALPCVWPAYSENTWDNRTHKKGCGDTAGAASQSVF